MTVQEESHTRGPSGSDGGHRQRSLSGASASAARLDERRPSLLAASSSLAGLTIPEVLSHTLFMQMLAASAQAVGSLPSAAHPRTCHAVLTQRLCAALQQCPRGSAPVES